MRRNDTIVAKELKMKFRNDDPLRMKVEEIRIKIRIKIRNGNVKK